MKPSYVFQAFAGVLDEVDQALEHRALFEGPRGRWRAVRSPTSIAVRDSSLRRCEEPAPPDHLLVASLRSTDQLRRHMLYRLSRTA
jgi:hypothetical protein